MSGFSFSVKSKKKNVFQRQKELEEEKRKRDEEEAAKVYEDFVKDFGDGNEDTTKTGFVRGGVIEPGKRNDSGPPPSKRGRHYVPSYVPPGMATALDTNKGEEEEESVQPQMPPSSKGKLRSIDLLLQDLKRNQEERDQRKDTNDYPDDDYNRGNIDVAGDGLSTNIYLGNLAPDVDESTLMHEFGRFGPIGSVKVMWPRDEEQRRRGRNTGFVAFMERPDAERAKDALDGAMLRGMPITLGWGKCVPLPAVPIWPPPEGLAAAKEVGAPLQAPDAAWVAGVRGRRQADVPLAPPPRQAIIGVGPDVHVQVPDDGRIRFLIDAVAFYVARDGCDLEQIIMERELTNPEFGFLFDVDSPEHAYYRWRLYSLASGDTLRSWRVEPFLMVEHSNRWFPPPMTIAANKTKPSQQQQSNKNKTVEAVLPDVQKERFEGMLRTITVERSDICNAMVFAMDHADYAANIADILIDSLLEADAPVAKKIARLFLLSDLLHNTSAPVRNASKYRAKLQEALPDIFENFRETILQTSSTGRIAQELLKKHVLKVLRIWRGWFIFSDDYLNGLQCSFLRGTAGLGGFKEDENPTDASAELREKLSALTDDELQQKCKHSGLSKNGTRDDLIRRLLQLEAYLNGTTLNSKWNK